MVLYYGYFYLTPNTFEKEFLPLFSSAEFVRFTLLGRGPDTMHWEGHFTYVGVYQTEKDRQVKIVDLVSKNGLGSYFMAFDFKSSFRRKRFFVRYCAVMYPDAIMYTCIGGSDALEVLVPNEAKAINDYCELNPNAPKEKPVILKHKIFYAIDDLERKPDNEDSDSYTCSYEQINSSPRKKRILEEYKDVESDDDDDDNNDDNIDFGNGKDDKDIEESKCDAACEKEVGKDTLALDQKEL